MAEQRDGSSVPTIKKEKMNVVIMTERFMIEGTVYLIPRARLSDFMNRPDSPFIPMTEVVVHTLDGSEYIRTDFLSLNKSKITFISVKD